MQQLTYIAIISRTIICTGFGEGIVFPFYYIVWPLCKKYKALIPKTREKVWGKRPCKQYKSEGIIIKTPFKFEVRYEEMVEGSLW